MLHKLGALITVNLIFVKSAWAQGSPTPTVNPRTNPLDRLQNVGTSAGYADANESTLLEIVGTVINAFLGLLGTVFIILIIVAGFNWMTAGGEQEKIKKAGDMIRSSIIGLIIVIGAFAIWTFIDRVLLDGGSSATPGGNG